MGRGSTVLLCLCVLCVLAPLSCAAVFQAPSDPCPTIQPTVDDVGRTAIELAEHTFLESVAIPRDVIVRGTSPETTVIAGPSAPRE
jgi:hypothetical protein